MRCFIALDLPEGTKEALAEAARRIVLDFPGSRAVRPESFHLTLAFLGDVGGPALECAREATLAAAGTGAFSLEFAAPVLLPERGPPRVLALEVGEGARECRALWDRVNRTLSDAARGRGLGALNPEWPGGRRFRAHITLARSGSRPFPRVSGDAWGGITGGLQAPCLVGRCILYKSELHPEGARYEPLLSADLRRTVERSRDARG